MTRQNTFQKYFNQDELRQYIEDVLDTSSVAVGTGIFYVFRNPVDQQEFISNRSKRPIDWEQISQKLYPDRTRRRKLKREALYEENKDLLDSFWNAMLDLGRLPRDGEFCRFEELSEKVGTPKAAKKFFIERFGEETLKKAFEVRRNDLLVYLALSNFKRKIPFKHLSSQLQTDIKTFLGSYKKGLEESKTMLFSISNPDFITDLCNETQFGYFDHKALYIHKSLMNDLHPVLQIYVGCAGVLYGDLNNTDIVKIHKRSGKVTLLKYDHFEKKNLPELLERVKVNLRQQRVDIFDHQFGPKQQLLYFKELYVGKDHPNHARWAKFSKKLRKLGFDDADPIGPSKEEFLDFLQQNRLTINLNKKRK